MSKAMDHHALAASVLVLFRLDHVTKLVTAWPYEAAGVTMGTINMQQHEEEVR